MGETLVPPRSEAGGGTRTHGRLITNQVLYQLSYSGVKHRLRRSRHGDFSVAATLSTTDNPAMQPTDTSAAERILADRARYVAPGMSTPRLVVARAEGARVTDPDGRTYIDFAGGIGCQNTGHRHAAIVEAIKEQADRYLHQCFMIGVYEPYVEVCRRLAELSPCSGGEQRSILVNSGAEAVENAVKIARWATGRPAVVAFDNAFHGRTLLAMTMMSKVKPYKAGFGPFAPEVYRAPSPYPYHGISSDDSIAALEHLFKADVDPATVACLVLEPVQGEGGFLPMPPDYPAKLQELCRKYGILWVNDEVQSGVGRTGTMWAVEQYAGAEPDMTVFGKSIGGGLPLAGVTGGAEVMDAVPAGGLGGRSEGTHCRAPRRSPSSTSWPSRTSSPAHASSVSRSAPGSTTSPRAIRRSARCAASARCSPSSSPSARPTAPRRSSTSHSSAVSCSSRAASTAT